MLKVYFAPRVLQGPAPQWHPTDAQIWQRRQAVAALDVFLQDEPAGADVAWAHTHRAGEVLRETGLPVIVDDQRDSATIRPTSRPLLSNPRVLAFVKHSAYRNVADYNAPHYNATLHGAKIYDASPGKFQGQPEPPTPQLSGSDLAKIVVGWGYQFYPRYRPLLETTPLYDPRPIDLHFIGTTAYGSDRANYGDAGGPYTATVHRQQLLGQLKALESAGYAVKWGAERQVSTPEYFQQLLESKIVCCPWGYGERTHREIEGALAGCICVRPNTDWATSWPNLRTVDVALDWHDLGEVVARVLADRAAWFASAMRQRAALERSATEQAFARRFVGIVKTAMEKVPCPQSM